MLSLTTRVQLPASSVENCGEMTIEVTTPAAAQSLADYLDRCGCTVQFVSDRVLQVAMPARSQSDRDAMIELRAYLSVWRAMHPMHVVKHIDDAGSSSQG